MLTAERSALSACADAGSLSREVHGVNPDRLDQPMTVEAGFAWFWIVLCAVFLVAVFLWSMLDGPVHGLLTLSTDMADSSRGETSARRVRLVWEYWPLWGLLAAILMGYRRAVNETNRRP